MPPISSHQDKERLSFHPMEWGGFLGDLRDEDKSKRGSLNDCPAHLPPSGSGCELDLAVLTFNRSRFTVRS